MLASRPAEADKCNNAGRHEIPKTTRDVARIGRPQVRRTGPGCRISCRFTDSITIIFPGLHEFLGRAMASLVSFREK